MGKRNQDLNLKARAHLIQKSAGQGGVLDFLKARTVYVPNPGLGYVSQALLCGPQVAFRQKRQREFDRQPRAKLKMRKRQRHGDGARDGS